MKSYDIITCKIHSHICVHSSFSTVLYVHYCVCSAALCIICYMDILYILTQKLYLLFPGSCITGVDCLHCTLLFSSVGAYNQYYLNNRLTNSHYLPVVYV